MKTAQKRLFFLVFISAVWLALPAGLLAQEADSGDDVFLNDSPESPASEDADSPEPKTSTDGDAEQESQSRKYVRDHFFQGFVNALVGTGYALVAPYDKDDPQKACAWEDDEPGRTGKPVCLGRSSWHMDFLAGFGVKPGLELFAMLRMGLDRPSELASVPRQIGAGIKTYTPNDGLFKIGFGVAGLFDFSDRASDSDAKDFVLHVPIAAQFDINRWVGPYVQVAPNVSFFSELKIDLTLGVGVQGRFI